MGESNYITPGEWLRLSKVELWRDWSEPGLLHNMLDEWADELIELRASTVPKEQLLAMINMLWPEEVTPAAKRMLLQLCEP